MREHHLATLQYAAIAKWLHIDEKFWDHFKAEPSIFYQSSENALIHIKLPLKLSNMTGYNFNFCFFITPFNFFPPNMALGIIL